MINSNICSGCHNHCLIKPRNVEDDTEDNNRNKELEHTLQDLGIGILLSVLVGVADSCVPEEEEIIKSIKISESPFPSNSNGCVDTTAEGDIVKRVEDLGEDVGVEGTVPCDRPRPN